MTIKQMNGVGLERIGTNLVDGLIWTIHDDGLRLWERTDDPADFRVRTLFKRFSKKNLHEAIQLMNDWGYVYGQPNVTAFLYGYKF